MKLPGAFRIFKKLNAAGVQDTEMRDESRTLGNNQYWMESLVGAKELEYELIYAIGISL